MQRSLFLSQRELQRGQKRLYDKQNYLPMISSKGYFYCEHKQPKYVFMRKKKVNILEKSNISQGRNNKVMGITGISYQKLKASSMFQQQFSNYRPKRNIKHSRPNNGLTFQRLKNILNNSSYHVNNMSNRKDKRHSLNQNSSSGSYYRKNAAPQSNILQIPKYSQKNSGLKKKLFRTQEGNFKKRPSTSLQDRSRYSLKMQQANSQTLNHNFFVPSSQFRSSGQKQSRQKTSHNFQNK